MRVLIAHDRAEIAERIKSIAIKAGAEQDRVIHVLDGTSARRELVRSMFDLFIIDLTLPHIFGRDKPSYQVADQLLKEIFLLEDLKTPADIIAITKDSDALGLVQNDVGANVMAIIEEDGLGAWEAKLSEKISYTKKVSASRQSATNSQFDYDCVLITALDKELSPFRSIFEFSEFEEFAGTYTFVFTSSDGSHRRGAAFAVGKSGVARAAAATQVLLALFRPKLLIMTGICGGVRGKTALGDVVIADSAVDWDYGKWSEPKTADGGDGGDGGDDGEAAKPLFLSRPHPVSIEGSRAHRLAREFLDTDFIKQQSLRIAVSGASLGLITAPSLHLAPMASGSSVIASDMILESVRGLNEAIRGVDMECFGLYYAASTTHVIKPEFVCIKSVSDYSNGTKNDEYHSGAAFLSAFIASELIQTRWDFAK